jgi:hypothetical protein
MKRRPDPVDLRVDELQELFEPVQALYGESYMERLLEDEELVAKVRDRFERGKTDGRFPALSDHLSNFSAKEQETFFKTGDIEAIIRNLVPSDAGVRFRQIRALLRDEPEFITRYPEAYRILLAHTATSREWGGLPLPSFGVTILRHEPIPHAQIPHGIEGDAFSATHVTKPEIGQPPVNQSFEPVGEGFLRGVLLTILSREEYSERIANYHWDSDLFEDVDVPRNCEVRITDLRLASVLDLEDCKRFLLTSLDSLKSPVTIEHVVEWKRLIIGNRVEDAPHMFWEKFGDEVRRLSRSAAAGARHQEAWDALMVQMQEYREAHATEPLTANLTEEEIVSWKLEIATASFAAAALLLFVDLDMPSMSDEKPYRLAEQIRELARIIKKLMSDLDDRRKELDALIANRPSGRQPRLESHYYRALCYWRFGHSPEDIAQWLGITPYSSKTGRGTRNWKTRLKQILAKGQAVECERFPRATAIFANYQDNTHIRSKAHRAYRTFLVQRGRFPNYPPLSEVGRKIRVNHQKQRGLEIIRAYILLGSCLVRGVPTAP